MYHGQARKSLWIETLTVTISCGRTHGQARKSLWIETCQILQCKPIKKGQARKSLWIETVAVYRSSVYKQVRLVRACGSKQQTPLKHGGRRTGQARKSLWIETIISVKNVEDGTWSGS